MISCTDFIPSYSELFKFLEDNYGNEAVQLFWKDLFDPNKNGPTHLLEEELTNAGLAGCWNYWTHTLNEEAADFEMYLNEADGWYLNRMNHCPSKGRLLEATHLEPYHDYCSHCDLYRQAVEKHGLVYTYDFTGCGEAKCSLMVTDPAKFKGTMKITPETKIMKRSAADNRYFHKDFHLSANAGLEYLGLHYGEEAVVRYLTQYTRAYLHPLVKKIRENGLGELVAYLEDLYAREEASDVLSVKLDGDCLAVSVRECPAVRHIKVQGREVSRWYQKTLSVVMAVIAEDAGYRFSLDAYNPETGAAKYVVSL